MIKIGKCLANCLEWQINGGIKLDDTADSWRISFESRDFSLESGCFWGGMFLEWILSFGRASF